MFAVQSSALCERLPHFVQSEPAPLTAEISSEPSANLRFFRGAVWCIFPFLTQDLKVL